MTNNTINNVPRELLEVIEQTWRIHYQGGPVTNDIAADAIEKGLGQLRTLLSATSPAGVGGCRCSMSISMLGDGCRYCQHQEYIDRLGEMLDEERAELSDARAIIDGLRGDLAVALKVPSVAAMRAYLDTECAKDNMRLGTERDQQAQRIGELEGLLLRVQVSLSLDDTEWGYSGAEKYKLLADIRAALSDGKDSAS